MRHKRLCLSTTIFRGKRHHEELVETLLAVVFLNNTCKLNAVGKVDRRQQKQWTKSLQVYRKRKSWNQRRAVWNKKRNQQNYWHRYVTYSCKKKEMFSRLCTPSLLIRCYSVRVTQDIHHEYIRKTNHWVYLYREWFGENDFSVKMYIEYFYLLSVRKFVTDLYFR